MFATSRRDMKPAYTCGTCHRRGLSGCSSHHIRVDRLDYLLKLYVKKVMENSATMLDQLNRDLEKEQKDVTETENCADRLAEILADLQADLKATKRQRIRDIMKHPQQEALLEETYDEMEAELQKKIEGQQPNRKAVRQAQYDPLGEQGGENRHGCVPGCATKGEFGAQLMLELQQEEEVYGQAMYN